MKRLFCLAWVTFHITAVSSGQEYMVRNGSENFAVSSIYTQQFADKPLVKIVRDQQGIYWFQCLTELISFDGINWKSYKIEPANKQASPIRINDVEVPDDGLIWVATSEGIYFFDPAKEGFIPLKQRFPGITGLPPAVSFFYQCKPGELVFMSAQQEGFFIFDLRKKQLKHIVIDGVRHTMVPGGEVVPLTGDRSGNLWGISADQRKVWFFDRSRETVHCSWRNELPLFAGRRFVNIENLVYTETTHSFWISYGKRAFIENLDLHTGESRFFSFSGRLNMRYDTSATGRYHTGFVKLDKNNKPWVRINDRLIVSLDQEAKSVFYLEHDPQLFSIGDWAWLQPERSNDGGNQILLWTFSPEKITMIRYRNPVVRHIPFDVSENALLPPEDYINVDTRQSIYFEKGRDGRYILLQQNARRPKLIVFNQNLGIEKVLLDKEARNSVAFFSQDFNADTVFVALMRPDIEAVDFRNRVEKEVRIDLRSLTVRDIRLDFPERVIRYGAADRRDIRWLYSNGYLYSCDPRNRRVDSIFITEPLAKGAYTLELVKGFDYPTVLHKPSSTFWIDFIPAKELYKINLETKKIIRVFRCCANGRECSIPGSFYDMYNFDSTRIYLQQGFAGLLLDTRTDSVVSLVDHYSNRLPFQVQNGSGTYRNWDFTVLPNRVQFRDRVTGIQKQLTIQEDFKWIISQFNSPPLVNDKGELVVMSSLHKGFLVVNIDSVPLQEVPGPVRLSYIKLDNRELSADSLSRYGSITLKYNRYKSLSLGFSDRSVFNAGKINYDYTLFKGGDTTWTTINGRPELTFSELASGNYLLMVRAKNSVGDISQSILTLPLVIKPPFTQTATFRLMVLAALGLVFYAIYRYRMIQLMRLQTIRNNIASDLHDDIGSTLNSISIYSEVARQQAGKPIPALELIGMNARKVVESMSDIVWTINPANDSFEKIIIRMRSFAHQLLKAKQVEYTFDVDEQLNRVSLPMQVRKNFYLVFKESINNLVKYSGASRVAISLRQENKSIILGIRDNGNGIPVNAETLGNGLMNMKRRAKEIDAELEISSANGEGTGIEMILKNE
jgi:signal transduction histidine kinase